MLKDADYKVHYQTSLIGLQEILYTYNPDIIILDIEIDDSNGIDALPEIKSFLKGIPVIFISSHSESYYKVRAIKEGGTTYLTKPINNDELLAYVDSFSITKDDSNEITTFGKWTIESDGRILTYKKTSSIRLSKKEYKLLILLARNSKRVVLRSEILKELYEEDIQESMDLSLNNFILSIRKHLLIDLKVEIKTVQKTGYRLFVK